jgi:hypothetical protein
MSQKLTIVFATLVGCAVMAVPAIAQPYFRAGSIPDLMCELVSIPGKLIATPFQDRGTASPEFLLRARLATVVLFGGMSYSLLRLKRL